MTQKCDEGQPNYGHVGRLLNLKCSKNQSTIASKTPEITSNLIYHESNMMRVNQTLLQVQVWSLSNPKSVHSITVLTSKTSEITFQVKFLCNEHEQL